MPNNTIKYKLLLFLKLANIKRTADWTLLVP